MSRDEKSMKKKVKIKTQNAKILETEMIYGFKYMKNQSLESGRDRAIK